MIVCKPIGLSFRIANVHRIAIRLNEHNNIINSVVEMKNEKV